MNKKLLFMFMIPVTWLILLGISIMAQITKWGSSGHPSNALIVMIALVIMAPAFGAVGLLFSMFQKTRDYPKCRTVSGVINIFLIGLGAGFTLWWFT